MIKTTDGLQLYAKNYLVDTPKANLLIVHGLGEHCERYAHVAKALNALHINVYNFDLRGHGKSEGTQAYIRKIDEYREDKLDPKSISRDPKTVAEYTSDPLIYRDGTKAGLGLALLNAIKELKPRFASFDYPMLIMHGGADKITSPKGSKNLFEQSKSKDKTLKIWEGAYHEIFNETNQDEVIELMVNWVKDRM